MAAAMSPPPPVFAVGEAVEAGVPTLRGMPRPAGYLAGGLATPIWTIPGGTAPLP